MSTDTEFNTLREKVESYNKELVAKQNTFDKSLTEFKGDLKLFLQDAKHKYQEVTALNKALKAVQLDITGNTETEGIRDMLTKLTTQMQSYYEKTAMLQDSMLRITESITKLTDAKIKEGKDEIIKTEKKLNWYTITWRGICILGLGAILKKAGIF